MNSLSIALAWQEAVNNRDVERVLELSDPNIEIVGPRGSGYGHELLRDWMSRAWLQLETLRTFEQGEDVVMEQHGIWRDVETGEIIGERNVASHVRVADSRITLCARYDTVAEGLEAMSRER